MSTPLRSAATEGLARLGGVAADRLPAFVAEMRAFAQRMDLQGPDPEVALIEDEKPAPGLQALWNEKKHRFEINPANIADKGMP